jgi:hypothetical protein
MGSTGGRLVVLLTLVVGASALLSGQAVTQPALKAAFLYNFAKFAEWPGNSTSTPLTLCVLDDSAVEDALGQLVGGGPVNGRGVTVLRSARTRALRGCHVLYLGDPDPGRSAAILDELKGAPVLTVGDGDQFVHGGGMVGLFIEDGRMHFVINTDVAQRVGIRLSSRLLSLARIVKDGPHGQF